MKVTQLHDWGLTIPEAKALQLALASQVIKVDHSPSAPRYIAGVDVSGRSKDGDVLAVVVVLTYPNFEVAEVATARGRPVFPYVPGYLSFRETPVLLQAFEALTLTPDIVLVDGHGYAHPRRFGIACHLGLLLDLPTVGCAKSVLVGEVGLLKTERGSTANLTYKDEAIGMALRTQAGVTPVYVSIGHKVDLAAAKRWALAAAVRYRLPEPTRLAHQAASGRIAPGLRIAE